MARGISAFNLYWHKPVPPNAKRPLFHRYGCPFCDFFAQLPSVNALARAAIGKARVRAHVLEKHPEKLT